MKKKNLSRKYDRLKNIIGLFSVIVGIIGIIKAFMDFGIWDIISQAIKQKPGWLWTKIFIIFILIVGVNLVLSLLWYPYFYKFYKEKRIWFFLKLVLSFLIIILLVFSLISLMFREMLPSPEVEKLFPQASGLGATLIRTYGTNGVANYTFHEESTPFGPKDGYAKITFRTFGNTVDQNCGWVIFLLRGVDISNYKEFRFLIRGERGNEKIGIKAKDARGVEIPLMLEGAYLRKGMITTDWQEVIVPLEDFGNVDFGLMDNFSIFTTGLMAGTRPQTIYVGNFIFI